VFHRDYSLDDGRYANNGWLQELPDPVTKIVWDNAVLVSRKTAADLGLANSEVVEISFGDGKIEGPVWIQPGQADHSLGLALGYGRPNLGASGKEPASTHTGYAPCKRGISLLERRSGAWARPIPSRAHKRTGH
jgi:anaerobic selenocysteine-containing dehydrogenase